MAASEKSIEQARIVGRSQGVLQLLTVGLGIVKTALVVFNNFVELIATNVISESVVKENFEAEQTSIAVE